MYSNKYKHHGTAGRCRIDSRVATKLLYLVAFNIASDNTGPLAPGIWWNMSTTLPGRRSSSDHTTAGTFCCMCSAMRRSFHSQRVTLWNVFTQKQWHIPLLVNSTCNIPTGQRLMMSPSTFQAFKKRKKTYKLVGSHSCFRHYTAAWFASIGFSARWTPRAPIWSSKLFLMVAPAVCVVCIVQWETCLRCWRCK